MKSLVLVDFDKTLTTIDTTKILIFVLLKSRPWLIFKTLYFFLKMRFSTGVCVQFWKNRVISELINGKAIETVRRSLEVSKKLITSVLDEEILARLKRYSEEGKVVLIVTASPSFAVNHFMQEYPYFVIGTEFEVENGFFGCKPVEPICYGEGKVEKISSWVRSNIIGPFEFWESWSDELSDMPMMSLSKNKVWVCSKNSKIKLEDCFQNAEFFFSN
jgi:HAD superfamily phosphoserine phosphatase-like hydrolase